MKSQRSILTACLLNLAFSVFEFIGGLWTGSIAIVSDAVHDLGDAAAIGISWWLERRSRRRPDRRHTYGYARCSVLGGVIATLILVLGSAAVIVGALGRLRQLAEIRYGGMIGLAVVGLCVNLGAALATHRGQSLNQRAVYLHMLEDVLGWLLVLVGAVVMRFTGFALLDPLLSIAVALFILVHAAENLKSGIDLFLEKVPPGLEPEALRESLTETEGVLDVHHMHLWSMDGQQHCATLHIVTDGEASAVKGAVREKLRTLGIAHATLELERTGEPCGAPAEWEEGPKNGL